MRQERFTKGRLFSVKQIISEAIKASADIRAVAMYYRVYRWRLLSLIFLSLIAAIPPLLTPLLMQTVIDKAYPARDYRLLVWVGVGLSSLIILSRAFSVMSGYLFTYVKNCLQYRLSFRVISALQRLPQSYREEHGKGGLLVRADRDVQAVVQSVTQLVPDIATLIFSFLVALALMMRLNPGITLFVLAFVPVNYLVVGQLTSKLMGLNKAAFFVTDQITTFVGETIEGTTIARLFSLNRLRRRKLRILLRKRLQLAFASWKASAFWGQLAGLVGSAWGAIVLGVGWYLVFSGRLKLGQAVALGMYIGMLTRPFDRLAMLYKVLLMDSVAAGRLLEILHGGQAATQTGAKKVLSAPPRQYELRGLSFGYKEEHLVLHNINLSLRAGQTVVVVGPTGEGKSTLLRILCGLDDKYSGQFLIDNNDFRDIDRDSYLHRVSWVPQTHFFFSDSIHDNLCPHDGFPIMDRLHGYAAALGLDSVIDATPEGYDTKLGEQGVRFSVGQYQKLAAMRAILKDASILLLDEVAASMDIESERRLLQGIISLRSPDCLTVLVTHHISITVEPWVDEIIVLVNGRIAEKGSSAQLREKGGFYHNWLSLIQEPSGKIQYNYTQPTELIS